MNPLVFVKFGGSFITDKSQEEKANKQKINELSFQIKEALIANNKLNLIIGNGAGSFGHIQVKKYKLKNSIKTIRQKIGFAKVSNLVSYLNYLVVASLIKHNLPAVSIKPSSITIGSGNKIKKINSEILTNFLREKIIPVLYGDMIFDEIKGGAVLSTDRLFYELIKNFIKNNVLVDKVIFCGSTNGVLDQNGKTISFINRSIFMKIQPVFFDNPYVDVTGSMKSKVETALKIADLGIKSYIIKGEELKNCLLNKKFSGTKIL